MGVFDIKAKFMGVHLETLMLEYQVKSDSLFVSVFVCLVIIYYICSFISFSLCETVMLQYVYI